MEEKIVEYEGTKNHYRVLSENAKMKNPETREWQECVIYEDWKYCNSKGEYTEVMEKQTYVREKKEFWGRFTLCLDL